MSINHVVREYVLTVGSAFTVEQIADDVARLHPDVFRETQWKAWVQAVRRAATQSAPNGLPLAASIDDHGTYMQTALLEVDEFKRVIVRYMKAGRANTARAYAYADECLKVHGVALDPDELLREEDAEEGVA